MSYLNEQPAIEKVRIEAEAAEISRCINRRAKTGYGRPPIDGQFKKGVSGNPRGRPRKAERSLTRRQIRRDFLRIVETLMTVRTEKGSKKVTVIEAIILRAVGKALAGHGPSMRWVMKWYSDQVDEHSRAHRRKFDLLEEAETIMVFHPEEGETEMMRAYLTQMRELTRRI
jgi:hypothetical protein